MDQFREDWFSHPEYWFHGKEHDSYIVSNYAGLLANEWIMKETDLHYHLAYVVLYDQIPRHIYRNDPEKDSVVQMYLEKALYIHDYMKKSFDLSKLTSIEWCFLHLPIRHSLNEQRILKVIQEAWEKLKICSSDSDKKTLLSFLKASYERCPKKQISFIHEISGYKTDFHEFTNYLDLLAFCPVTYHPEKEQLFEKKIEQHIVTNKVKRLILSISGGVDSMVCSHILAKLQNKWKFTMAAVYINYNNRTIREYEFVNDWCKFLQIPLYTRHMNEIQRKPCMENNLRTTYETYTRNVRFQTYKDVWNHFLSYPDFPQVFLGHNSDDCFENIMTNICHKSKYENLYGMSSRQVMDDIIFHRPMLDISKQEIYRYAHEIGIPYLNDSTPSWSQRGQIRDKVRPCLEEWNPNFVSSMFELSNRIQEYEYITEMVVTQLLENTKETDKNYKTSFHNTSLVYSKIIWTQYLQRLNISVRYKSLHNLMEQIHTKLKYLSSDSYVKVVLNKNYIIQLYYKKGEVRSKITYKASE